MAKNILNIAAIGCSEMGRIHIKGLTEIKGINLYAICDSARDDRLQKTKEEFNVPVAVKDYKELLGDENIDAVLLVVPDQVHLEMTLAFLRDGMHVHCEKPMALTMEECVEMMRVEKETGKQLMIGQICRFTDNFKKAKELVDAGRIGELYFVESEYAHHYGHARGYDDWRVTPERDGFIGGGCHAVDLLRWIAGDPYEIFSYGVHKLLPTVPYDDATISIMKFPNNVIGKIFVSTGCKRDYTMRTVLYGTKGTIICDNTSDHMQLFTVTDEGDTIFPAQIIPIDINNHNAVKEVAVFVDCINGAPLMMSAEEGAKSVVACMAITESAKTGEKVVPNYNFD